MADEIDKFVLQYSVDLKDSISRLEKLNEKMNQVEKKGSDTQSGIAKWTQQFKKAKGEIVGASSSVEGFMSGVGKLPARFLGIAAAIAAIAGAIKLASAAAQEFREQRITGQNIGVGEVNVEQMQRRYAASSGGKIGASEARGNLEQLAQFQESAFTDVQGMGKENILLRKMGVKGGNDIDKFIDDLQNKFATMTQEQSRAYGDLIGLSRNFTDAMREAGKSQQEMGKMTEAEAKRSVTAAKATVELDAAMGKISESFRNMKHEVGDLLLPVLSKGVDLFSNLTSGMEKGVNALTQWLPAAFRTAGKQIEGAFNVASGKDTLAHAMSEASKQAAQEVSDMNSKVSNETLKQAKEQNNSTRQTNLQLKRDINMFSGAVQTFANAIDQQQAWAAWAGEVGRASGLQTPSNIAGPSDAKDVAGTNQYDAKFEEGAKRLGKYGFTSADLKAQVAVESNFNTNAVSRRGAIGLGQIMPETAKAFGYTAEDMKNPLKNLEVMFKVLEQNAIRFGSKEAAQKAYNGGWEPSKWTNRETAAYVGKIEAAKTGSNRRYGGEDKSLTRQSMTENDIAKRMGYDVKQLRRGEASKGDVAWEIRQLEAGALNGINRLKNELQYNQLLTPMKRNQLNTELHQQQIGLNNLRTYGAKIEGYSRPGGREITIGEMPIQVVVGGSNASPQEIGTAVGQGVSDQLKNESGQIVNDRSHPLYN